MSEPISWALEDNLKTILEEIGKSAIERGGYIDLDYWLNNTVFMGNTSLQAFLVSSDGWALIYYRATRDIRITTFENLVEMTDEDLKEAYSNA